MWRLPGLDALPAAGKDRAYRNVGGHPRTLEYLDALLRGGQARFEDVAERMEDRLRDRGIADPAAWLARPGRDLDASLAEAVTLSVDDVVLSGLLERLAATPVATELVTGASVYRVPVDDTALVFQVGQPAQRPPDPERRARIRRVQQAIEEAIERADGGQISLEDTGLTAEEYARYEADLAEELRPPVEAPAGLAAAVAAARAAGLLAPVPRGDQDPLHFVHRWTAGAIAALHPDATSEAHRRAAAFWHWRVTTIPQSREARRRPAAGGPLPPPRRRAAQTRRWPPTTKPWTSCKPGDSTGGPPNYAGKPSPGSPPARESAAATEAHARHPGPAAGGLRRPPSRSTAGPWKSSSASATRRAWPRATTSSACWPSCGGTTTPPSRSYRRSLEIFERLGDQAGMSASYHQLGILAQLRGDYDAAEPPVPPRPGNP